MTQDLLCYCNKAGVFSIQTRMVGRKIVLPALVSNSTDYFREFMKKRRGKA